MVHLQCFIYTSSDCVYFRTGKKDRDKKTECAERLLVWGTKCVSCKPSTNYLKLYLKLAGVSGAMAVSCFWFVSFARQPPKQPLPKKSAYRCIVCCMPHAFVQHPHVTCSVINDGTTVLVYRLRYCLWFWAYAGRCLGRYYPLLEKRLLSCVCFYTYI